MKNLYGLQTLLVVIFSLLTLPWASSQIAEPLTVNVKNSGSSFSDQFAAASNYAYEVVLETNTQLGSYNWETGTNTLKFTFTPNIGVTGTVDYVISYYTLSTPMYPVTRSYHINIVNEVITANKDEFVVDVNGIAIPLDVLDNDTTTGAAIHLSTIAVSNSGAATINPETNSILFTPDQDFTGDTWIQYIACDSSGNCGEGKAHILVRDPNAQDNLVFQKFLLNQEKLEILTPQPGFEVSINPAHGTIDSTSAIGWTYTPAEGYLGNDTIELNLLNLISRKYIITVYIKAVNVQAKDDRFYVRPGLSVGFNVLDNDLLQYDITSHTNPTKGSLYEIGSGQFIYTPNTGYRGVDKFTYTTCYDDTVYCETATVLLHVTDLEPDNVFTYALQTSRDLPLTIDYPISYTDFAYIISNDPQHGVLTYNSGVQEIDLPCDTLESYNMLVYTPEAGYTGADHFEYYYCIEPSNLCYLVKVNVNVIEAPEDEECACVVDCVWPGDNDQNGRVDMNDLLTMGYRLGATGLPRTYNDPGVWFGQHSPNWSDSENIQYTDANGDGAVTAADVDVISDHYNMNHDIVTRDVQQRLPYQFSIIPVQFSLDSGDVVILDIAFGNAGVPVLDMKGAKFSVNIPPWMLDSSSVEVNFHQDAWLAEGAPFISLGKVPWDGRIDAGFVKANGNGASGFGVIATIVFIIEDDAEGFKSGDGLIHLPITLESGVAMDASGVLYDVDGDETYLTYDPNKGNVNPYNLILYPNPAQEEVNIHLNGKTTINSISIIDPQGRIIRQIEELDTKHYQMDVTGLPVGLYYVEVHHEHGVMTQLLSVIH